MTSVRTILSLLAVCASMVASLLLITPSQASAQCWTCDFAFGGTVCAGQVEGKFGSTECGQDYGPTGDPFCAPSGEVCESGPMALRMSGQIVPEAQVATYRDEQSPEARSVTLCDGSRIQVTEVSVEERRRIKSIVIR